MKHRKTILIEGGNLSVRGHNANPIDLTQVDRSKTIEQLTRLFSSINKTYESLHNRPLWDSQVFESQNFLSGSSRHFFNLNKIPDRDFKAVKPKVGDIDVMIDRKKQADLADLFNRLIDKQVGPAIFIGFKKGNQQFSTLWNFPRSNLNIQIDFEFVEFDKNGPTDWSIFSHSSAWRDMEKGIKGVFHKFLIQSLTSLSKKQFLLRKMAGRGSNRAELDKPMMDNQLSFSVWAKAGG
jgi:hypothetical protein